MGSEMCIRDRIGTLLNVTLLAYASDEKLYSARANFPNQAKRNRAGDEKIVVLRNKAPVWEKDSTRSTLSIRCTVKQT